MDRFLVRENISPGIGRSIRQDIRADTGRKEKLYEEDIDMTLGGKIYALRVKEGFSQEAFGEKLGVSRQSVSKWETDQSVPELDKIVMISELFAVSTDYLLKESMEEDRVFREEGFADTQKKNPQGTRIIIERSNMAFEYKSKKTWRGMPVVHVNIGFGRRAKGVIAIGLVSQGIVAIGLAGLGVITVAPVGVGLLLAIGGIVVGGIAVGSVAVGIVSMGAMCLGLFSMGALAVGQFSFGAMAIGQQVAIGDSAHGDIALGFSEATGRIFEQVQGADGSFDHEGMLRAIDENVAGYWFIFKQWMKGIIRMMAGV